LLALWLSLAGLGAFACSGTPAHVETMTSAGGDVEPIPVPSDGPVIAVAPPDLPAWWTDEERRERTDQIVRALRDGGWRVIAPGEYDVRDVPDGVPLLDRTNVASAASERGVEARRLWVLDTQITETIQQSEVVAEHPEEAPRSRRRTSVQREIRLSLADPRIDEVLATARVTLTPDAPMDVRPAVAALTHEMRAQEAGPNEPAVPSSQPRDEAPR